MNTTDGDKPAPKRNRTTAPTPSKRHNSEASAEVAQAESQARWVATLEAAAASVLEVEAPLAFSQIQRDTWARQQRFLSAYITQGNRARAAVTAGIDRRSVYEWAEHDRHGFNERFKDAEHSFRELFLESKLFEIIGSMKPGHNPLALVFALKSAWPSKYGDRVTVTDDTGQALVARLTEMRAALGRPGVEVTIEGTAKAIGDKVDTANSAT